MKWECKPLEDLADFCLGKMLDQKKNRGDPMPYLANVNVRWGEFDFENLREMRFELGEVDRYGLKNGDIVMCEGGEPGRCAIWKEQIPGMMIQKALHRIRPHACLDSQFLYYSFLKKGKKDELSGLFTGSTIKHLPREKLAKVQIEFPPLVTQRRIAQILFAYDELIENNRRRITLLEEAARVLYREWFVCFRFPGHGHLKMSCGIPEGWEMGRLGDLLTLKRGYDLPEARRIDGPIPIVSSSGITGYHNEKKVNGPGIITGRYGTIGQVFLVEDDFWPLNTALYVVDFKGNPPVFVLHVLLQVLANIQSDKAAVPGLNRNVLHTLKIAVPPFALRKQFGEIASINFKQIQVLKEMNKKLADARDLLLPRLMNQEIAV